MVTSVSSCQMSSALKVHIETTTEFPKQPHRPPNWLSSDIPTCKQHKGPQRPHRHTLCKKHSGIACMHYYFDKTALLGHPHHRKFICWALLSLPTHSYQQTHPDNILVHCICVWSIKIWTEGLRAPQGSGRQPDTLVRHSQGNYQPLSSSLGMLKR